MEMFIGTKIVAAKPMNRLDYNEYRNWNLPENENGADEGYLVENQDGGRPNDKRHDGYISWSPKEQFDKAYRPLTGLTFGHAIEALKAGLKVARAGWNGEGMWVTHMGEDVCHDEDAGIEYKVREYLAMKAVDGDIVPWVASQTDMLAEDWLVVE